MQIYRITVNATTDTQFSGRKQDESEHYIAAYSCDQALQHVRAKLEAAGWNVNHATSTPVLLTDIRDLCDHITDL